MRDDLNRRTFLLTAGRAAAGVSLVGLATLPFRSRRQDAAAFACDLGYDCRTCKIAGDCQQRRGAPGEHAGSPGME